MTTTEKIINEILETSVSHATLRPQDLIPPFLEVIKDTPEYQQMICQINPDWNFTVITDPSADDNDERWQSDYIIMFLDELFDVLNNYAPEGYYFGSHIGDGSDFGYWKIDQEFF